MSSLILVPDRSISTSHGTYRKDSSTSSEEVTSVRSPPPVPKPRNTLKRTERITSGEERNESLVGDIIGHKSNLQRDSSSEASNEKQVVSGKKSSSLNGTVKAREKRKDSRKSSLNGTKEKNDQRTTSPSHRREISSPQKTNAASSSKRSSKEWRKSTSSESEEERDTTRRKDSDSLINCPNENKARTTAKEPEKAQSGRTGAVSASDTDSELEKEQKAKESPITKELEKSNKKKLYQRSSKKPVSFSDSQSLRSAAYQEWLRKKNVQAKEVAKAKETQKLKAEEKDKRRRDSETTFLAWKQEKEQKLIEEKRKLVRKKLEVEKKEKETKETKKTEAEKIFKIWKDVKEKEVRSVSRDRTRKTQKELEAKKQEQEEKKRDAEKIFEKWREMKDKEIRNVVSQARRADKTIKRQQETRKMSKEQIGQEAFQAWLERKEEERLEKIHLKNSSRSDDDIQIPWLPPNKTVPFTLQPRT